MARKTKDQIIEQIAQLEIEAGRMVAAAGGTIGKILGHNSFPKYLKVIRKIQKLRDQL